MQLTKSPNTCSPSSRRRPDPICAQARTPRTPAGMTASGLRLVNGLSVAVLCFLLLASGSPAVQPDEILKDPALEARARALSAELRCLVCQNQSIDDSDAPLAKDLRVLIREHLVRGESDAQVKEFIVGRYGEFVLLKPRFNRKTAVLWTGPFLILILAGFFLWRRRPSSSPAESPLSDEEKAELRRVIGKGS